MTELFLSRGRGGESVRPGRMLGEGAAGQVFALADRPGIAAKLYHADAARAGHEAKIDMMLANPPALPPLEREGVAYPQIAWPLAKLYTRDGAFAGFTMPEIDFKRSTSLVNLLQKSSRRAEKISDFYGYRVLVARNLASVFAELHAAGHHMIDMKPANLRFYPATSWMAVVDADGFSIAGRTGRAAADRVSDEYVAPENWQRQPDELGVEQDRFALAVIIFQLLNNGLHPYAGGSGDVTDLQGRIQANLYGYALDAGDGLAPSSASLHRMFKRATRQMFDRAFARRDPRPAAAEWRDHLDTLIGQMVPCQAKPAEHVHFGNGCGFCAHEARIGGSAASRPRRKPAPRRPGVAAAPPARRPAASAARPLPMPPPPTPRAMRYARPARPPILTWGGAAAVALLVGATGAAWRVAEAQSDGAGATVAATALNRDVGEPSAVRDPTELGIADCAAGAAPIDRIVCAWPQAAAFERQLGVRYRQLADAAEGFGRFAMIDQQKKWLNRRAGCAGAAEPSVCLADAYRDRSAQLDEWRGLAQLRGETPERANVIPAATGAADNRAPAEP